jgi:hypothetical protein
VYAQEPPVPTASSKGYLNRTTLRSTGVHTLYNSLLTMTAHSSPVVRTNIGLVYSTFFSFFALVWVASFTANLAGILQQSTTLMAFNSVVSLEAAQKNGEVGPACVKASTAYATWLSTAFPNLKLKHHRGSALTLARLVANADCDVMIDSSPQVEFLSSSECSLKLHIPGQPLG